MENRLTECEVLSASANRATMEDVARKLYLSKDTWRNYLSIAID